MPLPLVAMGIGAGMGALSHLFGSHKPQVSTTSIDQDSQNQIRFGRDFSRGVIGRGMEPLDPGLIAAMQGYGGYAAAGQRGLNAFTDPSQMAQFQAYGNNVMSPYFDRQRMQLENSYRSNMAGARAFGVRGQTMGPNYSDINNAQTQFGIHNMENAQQIAQMMANYGQFGIQGQQNLGQYITDRPMNWNQQAAGLLSSTYGGPLSTSTTNPNPNDSGNLFQSVLGGAATGLSFGGMGGAPGASAPWRPQGYVPGGQPIQWPTFGQGR